MTYENQSAMKREDTKWTSGRDVWWQVRPKQTTSMLSKKYHATSYVLGNRNRTSAEQLCYLEDFFLSPPFHVISLKFEMMCVPQDVVPNFPTKCDVEWVDAEDPLFLLYTSGSTGKPKVP